MVHSAVKRKRFSSELSDATSSDQPHDLAVESSPQPVGSDPRPTLLALLKYLSDSELFTLISTRLAHAEPFTAPLFLSPSCISGLRDFLLPPGSAAPGSPPPRDCQQRPASNAPNACPSAILASLAALCTFLTPAELRRLVRARLDASAAPHHGARWFLEFMQSSGDAVPLGKAALDARHAQRERRRMERRVRLEAELEDAARRALEETARRLPLDAEQKYTDCHVAGPGDTGTRSPKRERVDVYMEPAPAPSVSSESSAPPPHGAPDVRPGLRTPPPLITKESSSPAPKPYLPPPPKSEDGSPMPFIIGGGPGPPAMPFRLLPSKTERHTPDVHTDTRVGRASAPSVTSEGSTPPPKSPPGAPYVYPAVRTPTPFITSGVQPTVLSKADVRPGGGPLPPPLKSEPADLNIPPALTTFITGEGTGPGPLPPPKARRKRRGRPAPNVRARACARALLRC